MINYIESYPNEFNNLIIIAIEGKESYSWRAAWLLSNCMEANDQRIKKYIKPIIERLKTVEGGYQRDLMNILFQMDLPEEYQGSIYDVCIDIWVKINNIPSVRYTAFKLILKITQLNIELYHEVQLLMEDHYIQNLSNGIKKSFHKMIQDFEKKNKKSIEF